MAFTDLFLLVLGEMALQGIITGTIVTAQRWLLVISSSILNIILRVSSDLYYRLKGSYVRPFFFN